LEKKESSPDGAPSQLSTNVPVYPISLSAFIDLPHDSRKLPVGSSGTGFWFGLVGEGEFFPLLKLVTINTFGSSTARSKRKKRAPSLWRTSFLLISAIISVL